MKISEEGLRLITSYEGYHRALPDGSCTAYQTKLKGGLDIPTIGFGCTEGVTMGMVWTREQAEQAFRKELLKHEAAVTRLVTVDINQHEFDALVSLSYNIGTGIGSPNKGLANSSVIKKLNKGDRVGAARAFNLYNKAKGHVERGLVSRRARESALFLKPAAKPEEPFMPQAVEPSREPLGAVPVGGAGAALGAVSGVAAATSAIPPPPPQLSDAMNNAGVWKGMGESAVMFGTFAYDQPFVVGSIVITVLFLTFGTKLLPEKWRPQ
ncbi:MAG: lysozyme [Hyphomicrobium sp.]|jgi:GH24 family phage-related lysozyme (muramidase)